MIREIKKRARLCRHTVSIQQFKFAFKKIAILKTMYVFITMMDDCTKKRVYIQLTLTFNVKKKQI